MGGTTSRRAMRRNGGRCAVPVGGAPCRWAADPDKRVAFLAGGSVMARIGGLPVRRVVVAAVAAVLVALGGTVLWRSELLVRPSSAERIISAARPTTASPGGAAPTTPGPQGRAGPAARQQTSGRGESPLQPGGPGRPDALGAGSLPNRVEVQGRDLLRLSAQAGVQAIPVQRMDIHRFVEATGSLVAAREQKLHFGVAGRVKSVAVQEGQFVQAGTLLAVLEDVDQQLALVKARNEYETARLEKATAQIEEKRLALETARRNLEATRLVAPFDGVVAQLDIRPGDQVTAAQQVAWLVDLNSLQAQVAVDEVDLAHVRAGQAVTVRSKTFPDLELPGRVERIATAGRTQGDLVLFDVVVLLERSDPRLRHGMSVTARIEVENARGVLAVPEEAVTEAGGRPMVTRVVGEEAVPTPVQLGVSDGRFVEVRSGLREGDRVLASNYALWRGASGGQNPSGTTAGANPFGFRLTPGGGPFRGTPAPVPSRTAGGH